MMEKKNLSKISNFYIHEVPYKGKNGLYGRICTGIYLKELILENEVYFPAKLAYEDLLWEHIMILYIKNICIVDKIFYHYYVNQNSTIHTKNAPHHIEQLPIEILKLEEYKKRGAFDIFYTLIEHNFIKWFFLEPLYIIFAKFDYIPDIINFMKDKVHFFFPNFKNELDTSNFNDLDKIMLRLLYIDGEIKPEMLEEVKKLYLETL